MKNLLLVLVLSAAAWSQEQKAPFTLAIVPSQSRAKEGAAMEITRKFDYAGQIPSVDGFYLVLTNVSDKPQAVFEFRNSWGTYAISLEIKMQNGKKYIAKYRGIFTKNYPSTFQVQPGEHMVYPMRLDGWWAPEPNLPKAEYLPATLKAIYKIETPAGNETDEEIKSVWAGKVESKEYRVTIRQLDEIKPYNPCADEQKTGTKKKEQSQKSTTSVNHPCGG